MLDSKGRFVELLRVLGVSLMLLDIRCAPCRISSGSVQTRSVQWFDLNLLRQLLLILTPVVQEYIADRSERYYMCMTSLYVVCNVIGDLPWIAIPTTGPNHRF